MRKIDIVMATYNGEKYLREQIQSIISQTNKEWNLLIRDDGSTDKTLDIIEEFLKKDDRIKLIKDTKGNLGCIKNFEELLKESKAKYIFLCDQDDIWREDKLDKCIKHLEKNQVIYHDAEVVFEQENRKIQLFNFKKKENILIKILKAKYAGCCMAFRREILDIILPIPQKYPAHDIWIGIIGEWIGGVKYIDDKLMIYRRHGNNVSNLSEKSKNSLLKKIKFRYYYLFYPLWRILKWKTKKY